MTKCERQNSVRDGYNAVAAAVRLGDEIRSDEIRLENISEIIVIIDR